MFRIPHEEIDTFAQRNKKFKIIKNSIEVDQFSFSDDVEFRIQDLEKSQVKYENAVIGIISPNIPPSA